MEVGTVLDFPNDRALMHSEPYDQVQIPTDIRGFREMEDGWKSGRDLVPQNSRLSWLSDIISRYYSKYAVAPVTCLIGESKIAFEWSQGPNVIMLDIDLFDHRGEYFSFDPNFQEGHIPSLNLDDSGTWTWLAEAVDRLAGVS